MLTQNDILLPDFLNFDIYPFDEKGWKVCCSGQNEKHTLVFLQATDTDETQAFLAKIFGAVKFNLEQDTLICKMDGQTKIALQAILQKHDIQKIIFFGVPPNNVALYLQIPPYQPMNWNNYQLLQVDALSKIAQTKQLKGALWQALQQMFL